MTPKASGMDGISVDMLRNASKEAVQELVNMYHEMERTMILPTQMKHNVVAMLPKTTQAERPIALMSVLYRAWVRLRWEPLKAWQTRMRLGGGYVRSEGSRRCPQQDAQGRGQ